MLRWVLSVISSSLSRISVQGNERRITTYWIGWRKSWLEPAAVVLGDMGRVELDKIDKRVAVGGVKGSVRDALGTEWDPREKEEDDEKEWDGVRSLDEPGDDRGTGLLGRRRLVVYEAHSSLRRHCVVVLLSFSLSHSAIFEFDLEMKVEEVDLLFLSLYSLISSLYSFPSSSSPQITFSQCSPQGLLSPANDYFTFLRQYFRDYCCYFILHFVIVLNLWLMIYVVLAG